MRIADFHNDIITKTGRAALPDEYFERNRVVTALFKGNRSFDEIIELAETTNSPYIAFEDIGYCDLDLEKVKRLNPVYVGLTWNGENRFGYGCDYNYGLKPDGLNLIKRLNEMHIAVDTAHISKCAFIDIIEKSNTCINSHTCFSSLFKHKRNIDEWQIRALIEKGSLIGVSMCGYFMTNIKTCKISDFIREIDYFCQRYPIDNLCLGTDFYGCDFLPDGITEDYSCFNKIAEELKALGYSEFDVYKIFYGNLSNFLDKLTKNRT